MPEHEPMSFEGLEAVYDHLARTVDAAGESNTPLLLTKTVLLLSNALADPDAVIRAIDEAARDL